VITGHSSRLEKLTWLADMPPNFHLAAQELLLFCFYDNKVRLQQEILSASDGFVSVEVLSHSRISFV
jgi:hypothetical protein